MLKIILFLFCCNFAQAYTLNNNFGASFKDNNVKVYIDPNTSCENLKLTIYELEELITPAVDNFWNRVPTSALRLSSGGFSTTPTTNINDGRLCAPTDEECIQEATNTVIAPARDIVVACNNLEENFGGANVLAVTIPNNFSGNKIIGAVILLNNTSSAFARLGRSDQIGVMAHEIGHAIGLGHSDEKASLMYYRTTDQRKSLGEDDIRGVSYLYPMKLDGFGLLGGCGTIDTTLPNKSGPHGLFFQLLGALLMVIFLGRLLKKLSAKTSSST
jgi:hypothetical protein